MQGFPFCEANGGMMAAKENLPRMRSIRVRVSRYSLHRQCRFRISGAAWHFFCYTKGSLVMIICTNQKGRIAPFLALIILFFNTFLFDKNSFSSGKKNHLDRGCTEIVGDNSQGLVQRAAPENLDRTRIFGNQTAFL